MSDYFSTVALMPDGQLKIIRLEDYLGQFVVILFYQGDFTPFATSELLAFAGENEKFVENNCQVREHSHMTSDGFGVFLTYLPTLIRYFTT